MTPSAPTGFTITPGTGQMGLSWTASTDTTIAKYQYRRVDKAGPLRARPGNAQIELVWDAPDTGGLGVYKWQYQVQRIAAADMLGAIPSDSGATLWWKDPAVSTGKTVASWQYQDKVNTCPVCGWITTDIPGGADVRSHVVGNYNNGSQMAVQLRPKYTDNSYGSWSNTVVFTVGQSGSRWTDIPNSDDGTRSYVIPSLTNGDTYRLQVRGLSLRVLGHESVHPPYTAAVAAPSATVSDGWTDLPAIAATQTTSLTFTTLNWSTAQSASIKLSAAPSANVTVGLYQDGVVFTPSRLTFTTDNWNTAQSVQVKLGVRARGERHGKRDGGQPHRRLPQRHGPQDRRRLLLPAAGRQRRGRGAGHAVALVARAAAEAGGPDRDGGRRAGGADLGRHRRPRRCGSGSTTRTAATWRKSPPTGPSTGAPGTTPMRPTGSTGRRSPWRAWPAG